MCDAVGVDSGDLWSCRSAVVSGVINAGEVFDDGFGCSIADIVVWFPCVVVVGVAFPLD